MSNKFKKLTRRFLIVMALTAGAAPLTAASFGVSYNLRCVLAAAKHCYEQFGFTRAALTCIRDGSVACQATQN